MAIEFRVGDWHIGRRKHDYQRSDAGDDVAGGAQGSADGVVAVVVVSGLVIATA
jgi:hypothetical protein